MALKLQIFISILLTPMLTAQTQDCLFSFNKDGYTCNLGPSADPNEIEEHLPGKSDDDVTGLFQTSTNQKLNCQNFRNLNYWHFWNMKVESFDEFDFKNCKSLTKIYFDNNKIEKIPENIFAGNPKIKYLRIKQNLLTTLPENIFANQKELEELDLSNNRISSLPENVFKPLINLQKLSLKYNEILTLNPTWFENLKKLKFLDLSANKMSELPDWILKPLVSLMDFYFGDSGNKIELSKYETTLRTTVATTIPSTTTTKAIQSTLTTSTQNSTPIPTTKTAAAPKTVRIGEVKDTCGKPKIGQQTIIGGTKIYRGSFPWNAALIRPSGDFFCGGTLVSNIKVVTAAHCIQEKDSSEPILARDIRVFLGVHNLTDPIEIGKVISGVKTVHIHPDWNPHIPSFDADIAVLELAEPIQFTNFIQPICMIKPNSGFPLDASGVVAGFGINKQNYVETVANVIGIPVVSYRDCSKSVIHRPLITHRTICGGYANGTGVCNGDSGSGLIVEHDGNYYLRGIVSASLFEQNRECNVHEYSVFTDVTKYYGWIITGDENREYSEIQNSNEKVEKLDQLLQLLASLGGSYRAEA